MTYSDLLLLYARRGWPEAFRRSAFRKFCRRNRDAPFVARTRDGFAMHTTIGDSVDNQIYVFGTYEEQTTRVIRALAPECACLVDVGCNIGYYSCLFRSVNSDGRLIAIDPNPEMVRRAKENLELNAFGDVVVLPYGMGAKVGSLQLHVPRQRHSLASLAYVPSRGTGGGVDSIEVEVKPLDDVIHEYHVDDALLKIDAEGFEYEVFAGLSEANAGRIKYIVFELSAENLEQASRTPEQLFSVGWMERFSVFGIGEDGTIAAGGTRAIAASKTAAANVLLARNDVVLPASLRDQ